MDHALIQAEVRDALRSFEAAERALDPVAVLSFIAPDFTMFQDGQRVDYETTVAQIQNTLPTLSSFETSFEDVRVIVLGPDAALTSMTFRDMTTDASGATSRMRGPSTLLWRRTGDRWRIVYADSDHYPDDDGDR